jgi:energy-coupling factor transporter transmembrane protein EcfT
MMSARLKLGLLLAWLAAVSLSPPPGLGACAAALLAAAGRLGARLTPVLWRAAAVVPFSGLLALAVWPTGGAQRAALLLAKSYLSAAAVVLFTLTTPVPQWTAVLRTWRVPEPLVSTLELLDRYLALLTAEARRTSLAMRARGGFRFSASTAAFGVLFARSWQRAHNVQRAMLARGGRL